MKRTGNVRIRRSIGMEVRQDAEQIDGRTHAFTYGWECDDGRYEGESAWIPDRDGWPVDAPAWIASGDIEWQPDQTPEQP